MSHQRRHLVSVIVPVYNDAARVELCVDALLNQTWPGDLSEIIVVDNGSDDDPASVLPSDDRVRLVKETKVGSFAARNTGVRVSRGTILAFTDADAQPDPDWIRSAIEVMDQEEADFVGGRTELRFRDPDALTPAETFQGFWEGRQRDFIEKGQWAPTLNLLVRKSVFERIGPFDETILSGSDVEWGRRAARMGVRQAYADAAIVRHEARRTIGALALQEARNADATYELFFRLEPRAFNRLRGLVFMTFLPGWRSLSLRRIREKRLGIRGLFRVLFVNEILRWVRVREFFRMSAGGSPLRR